MRIAFLENPSSITFKHIAMFRYVVSKTIQRFLSTYLDDLNVENVSLSIPGFEEWSGGLDLKDVKLKEGAELFEIVRDHIDEEDKSCHSKTGSQKYNGENLFKQELVKVTIGENGSIGRISASFTGTQDMSLRIQDMFVTINVEKSFVSRTKLEKENSTIDEEVSFSRGQERHPSCDQNSDTSSSQHPPISSEGSTKKDAILRILTGLEIDLENIYVRLVVIDKCCDYLRHKDEETTIMDIEIENISLKSDHSQSEDPDDPFATYFNKAINIGGNGNIGMTAKVVFVPSDLIQTKSSRKKLDKCDGFWARNHWDSLSLFQCTEMITRIRFCLAESPYEAREFIDGIPEIESGLVFGMNVAVPSSDLESRDDSVKCFVTEPLPYQSSFHRVFRGLRRQVAPGANPLSDDSASWGCKDCQKHALDSFTPLPGFVMHVSALVPIEVNICRRAIDAISSIHSAFQKQNETHLKEDDELSEMSEMDIADSHALHFQSQESHSSESNKSDRQVRFNLVWNPQEKCDAAFPECMQPQFITIVGLQISKFILRFEIMRLDSEDLSHSRGYGFSFMEFFLSSFALDLHQLSSPEVSFNDLRMDVARVELNEFKGIERNKIFAAGFTFPKGSGKLSCQPSRRYFVAEMIFDIPPLISASQTQNSALQVCLFSTPLSKSAEAYGCVEVRLGAFDLHMRKDTIGEVKSSIAVMKRALNSHNTTTLLSSRPPIDVIANREAMKSENGWGVSLTTDGGTLNW